jgi:hypothetical protein
LVLSESDEYLLATIYYHFCASTQPLYSSCASTNHSMVLVLMPSHSAVPVLVPSHSTVPVLVSSHSTVPVLLPSHSTVPVLVPSHSMVLVLVPSYYFRAICYLRFRYKYQTAVWDPAFIYSFWAQENIWTYEGGSGGQDTGVDYIMRSSITHTLHQILLGWSNRGRWDWQGRWNAWERWELHTEFELKTWREET